MKSNAGDDKYKDNRVGSRDGSSDFALTFLTGTIRQVSQNHANRER